MSFRSCLIKKGFVLGRKQVRFEAAEDAPFHAMRPELAIPADPLNQFDRVMVVIAHPDDESMASGTIARFTELGKAVRVVVLTNGDKGSGDLTMTSERLAELRADEMHAAASVNKRQCVRSLLVLVVCYSARHQPECMPRFALI
eukprot:COSAG02_NODE_1087_length_14672_cov_189.858437_3_plen_144_part_00